MSPALRLSQLLPAGESPAATFDPVLTGMNADSRSVQPGEAFIALAGASTHGLKFADVALARGAAAILFEPPAPESVTLPAHAVAVPQLRQRLGALADRCYGSPSSTLSVIGVTGTNGKTSTVQLLSQALSLRGRVAGSIGTLGAGLHGALRAGERTTPDVVSVHRLLAELREQGAEAVAMEVSS
ncbi:MAG TPA: Mur ligase family protein, partial [Arenimonas sp.]|nr:Mur ligase family protein [Arenimonas sp.]